MHACMLFSPSARTPMLATQNLTCGILHTLSTKVHRCGESSGMSREQYLHPLVMMAVCAYGRVSELHWLCLLQVTMYLWNNDILTCSIACYRTVVLYLAPCNWIYVHVYICFVVPLTLYLLILQPTTLRIGSVSLWWRQMGHLWPLLQLVWPPTLLMATHKCPMALASAALTPVPRRRLAAGVWAIYLVIKKVTQGDQLGFESSTCSLCWLKLC